LGAYLLQKKLALISEVTFFGNANVIAEKLLLQHPQILFLVNQNLAVVWVQKID
jgi:hypothetical protein